MSELLFVLMVAVLMVAGVLLLWSYTRSRGEPLPPELNTALIVLAAAAVALAAASLYTA
ncbi:divalent metal cation (Fe/Co/Zn/Cd) transporter [Nocardiopsis mwathae]|uniref:Divalent metal cation (Fe/Co/Zn/Cd) transporter n=1 Tax=Nocardiopsis mwathae TaxID=1472723 RepID=A0A7W9YFM1_9ACTN|nr:hypothetical protein [Nocardiopsis mwathae]MBB6171278.1 divalent metal cation (Fe/Co/Zn/Cd) transporter [Nocardiopsis mwathae]